MYCKIQLLTFHREQLWAQCLAQGHFEKAVPSYTFGMNWNTDNTKHPPTVLDLTNDLLSEWEQPAATCQVPTSGGKPENRRMEAVIAARYILHYIYVADALIQNDLST